MTTLPEGTLIIKSFPEYDYLDVYSFKSARAERICPDDVAGLFFTEIPSWTTALLNLRNFLVRFIGLKGDSGSDWSKSLEKENRKPGNRFGIFVIKEISGDEFMMGEEDSHLDFRVSVIVRKIPGGQEVFIATIVRFNNLMGKLYFLPVKPFHRIIVQSLVRRIEKKIG